MEEKESSYWLLNFLKKDKQQICCFLKKWLSSIIFYILTIIFLLLYARQYVISNDISLDNGLALGFLCGFIICYTLHIGFLFPTGLESWKIFKNSNIKNSNIDNEKKKHLNNPPALAFGFILLIFFVPFVFSIIFDLAELQSSILISRSDLEPLLELNSNIIKDALKQLLSMKNNLKFNNSLPSIILILYRAMVITLITIVLSVTFSTLKQGDEDYQLRQFLLAAFAIDFIAFIVLAVIVDLNQFFLINNKYDDEISVLFLWVTILSPISSLGAVLTAYFTKNTEKE